jgi:nucleoside-diphosphate-sugar epimerase
MTRPRAVVVGGTGFLGGLACRALDAAGWTPVVLSRRAVPGTVRTTLDADDLAELLCREHPDLVVNAAGNVWSASIDPAEPGNAQLPGALAEAVVKAAVPRLVHLGSAHEYAPAPHGTVMAEDFPTDPPTPYGTGKLAGSTALLDVAGRAHLDAVVLRVFNAVGPGMPRVSLLGRVAARLAAGATTIEVVAPTQHRDFVDGRDVAQAVVAAAAAAPGTFTGGLVVNVGSGTATDTAELAAALVAASGCAARVVTRADPGGRAHSLDWQCADIDRARHLLGWQPAVEVTTTTVRDIWARQAAARHTRNGSTER